MKVCLDCKISMPLSDFYKNKRKPDGFDIYCKKCMKVRGAANYQKNKEKISARHKEYQRTHLAEFAGYSKKWQEKNPTGMAEAYHKNYMKYREKHLAADKARRESRIDEFRERERRSDQKNKVVRYARRNAWGKENRHLVAAAATRRRSSKLQRTPPWLTDQQKSDITAMYLWAKTLTEVTGVPHHVDHIVPLRGRNVSGLHVPWNLQAIPAVENLQKNNRWEVRA